MKKRISLLLMGTLILGLFAGCGQADSQPEIASLPAVTEAPETVPETTAIPETAAAPAIEAAVPETSNTVTVSTVDDFLAAIAPDTTIVLDGELFDLSTAADYSKGSSDYYRWAEGFDGPELIIQNVEKLIITTDDEDVKAHTVSATPRYANVLRFDGCKDCTISGFTAGHTKEPGVCMGGVIYLENCENMTVDNCGLFGCGILGVQSQNCTGVNVLNSEIYECSNGGIQMWDTQDVVIENTTFRDLGGEELMFQNCQNITVDGKPYSA